MNTSEMAEAAQRVASAATYGGAGISAGSGASIYFGLSLDQWQVFGIFGGVVIGAIGLICNIAISIYFKRQHLLLARANGKADPEE